MASRWIGCALGVGMAVLATVSDDSRVQAQILPKEAIDALRGTDFHANYEQAREEFANCNFEEAVDRVNVILKELNDRGFKETMTRRGADLALYNAQAKIFAADILAHYGDCFRASSTIRTVHSLLENKLKRGQPLANSIFWIQKAELELVEGDLSFDQALLLKTCLDDETIDKSLREILEKNECNLLLKSPSLTRQRLGSAAKHYRRASQIFLEPRQAGNFDTLAATARSRKYAERLDLTARFETALGGNADDIKKVLHDEFQEILEEESQVQRARQAEMKEKAGRINLSLGRVARFERDFAIAEQHYRQAKADFENSPAWQYISDESLLPPKLGDKLDQLKARGDADVHRQIRTLKIAFMLTLRDWVNLFCDEREIAAERGRTEEKDAERVEQRDTVLQEYEKQIERIADQLDQPNHPGQSHSVVLRIKFSLARFLLEHAWWAFEAMKRQGTNLEKEQQRQDIAKDLLECEANLRELEEKTKGMFYDLSPAYLAIDSLAFDRVVLAHRIDKAAIEDLQKAAVQLEDRLERIKDRERKLGP